MFVFSVLQQNKTNSNIIASDDVKTLTIVQS